MNSRNTDYEELLLNYVIYYEILVLIFGLSHLRNISQNIRSCSILLYSFLSIVYFLYAFYKSYKLIFEQNISPNNDTHCFLSSIIILSIFGGYFIPYFFIIIIIGIGLLKIIHIYNKICASTLIRYLENKYSGNDQLQIIYLHNLQVVEYIQFIIRVVTKFPVLEIINLGQIFRKYASYQNQMFICGLCSTLMNSNSYISHLNCKFL